MREPYIRQQGGHKWDEKYDVRLSSVSFGLVGLSIYLLLLPSMTAPFGNLAIVTFDSNLEVSIFYCSMNIINSVCGKLLSCISVVLL